MKTWLQQKRVVLGKVGKVHGIKGWLRLNSFTSPPANILNYPSLHTAIKNEPRLLQIDDSREQQKGLIVHFVGFNDPESARSLTGLEVWVPSSELPELENGSFYWHELEGMGVVNLQGQVFGKVDRLMETGANDVMVVKPTAESCDQRERLIPFLQDRVVIEVSAENQLITVDWDANSNSQRPSLR